ncbi:peptidase inhibitor family I36 protein [Nocardia sp. NPDC050406]|uniref:peptidase inhibitor family I36 protein n=1 Tax=Nocardia sp. NPDC050406 TaxID=3364318 RepID=UPI0037A370A1
MNITQRNLARAAAAVLAFSAAGAAALASPTSASAVPPYSCSGGAFCGWDGRDGVGAMIVRADATCTLHDIGSGGVGDRLSSYWNRTGKPVSVYNWNGRSWQLLASIPNDTRGNLSASVDNQTDAVEVCA